jgi:hypothetical protein
VPPRSYFQRIAGVPTGSSALKPARSLFQPSAVPGSMLALEKKPSANAGSVIEPMSVIDSDEFPANGIPNRDSSPQVMHVNDDAGGKPPAVASQLEPFPRPLTPGMRESGKTALTSPGQEAVESSGSFTKTQAAAHKAVVVPAADIPPLPTVSRTPLIPRHEPSVATGRGRNVQPIETSFQRQGTAVQGVEADPQNTVVLSPVDKRDVPPKDTLRDKESVRIEPHTQVRSIRDAGVERDNLALDEGKPANTTGPVTGTEEPIDASRAVAVLTPTETEKKRGHADETRKKGTRSVAVMIEPAVETAFPESQSSHRSLETKPAPIRLEPLPARPVPRNQSREREHASQTVRIGSIEVRVLPPTPEVLAVKQPARPMAPRPSSTMLARGFGTFGLVQS